MEDLVYNVSELFSWNPSIGNVMDHQMPLALVFAAFGAVVLGKFTGSIGNITFLLNFSAMFIGSYFSNSLLHGLDLPIGRVIEQPMLISMIGMLGGAFLMMWWIQGDSRAAT